MKNADKPINPIQNNEGFPSFETVIDQEGLLTGLTKREYFAGLAMQGLLTRIPNRQGGETDLGIKECERIAAESIAMADELLKQLEAIKL